MHADLQLHRRAAARDLTPEQAFGAVAAIVVVLLVVFAPTTESMVRTWIRSETFAHGFLVVPAVLWMVWQRRAELARLPLRPAPWALLPLAAAGALWLLGEVSSSLAPSQFGLVAMIPCTVAALLGWRWLRALAFPLGFLFFAVPFGEFMVPTLIDWTADFTVAALAASGIPVYREANHFVIPSGRWSVVEACSGIRYLIASVMLGALYAWIVYRSPRKRLLFIAAAIAVPLIANWLRAYGIVLLGHLSDNRLAAGVDHLIYGWLFFGALMAAMFWIGARWRDDDDEPAARRPFGRAERAAAAPLPRNALVLHGGLVAVAILAWPLAAAALARQVDTRPLTAAEFAPAHGWSTVDGATPLDWMPDVKGAPRTQVVTFAKDGRRVSVVVAAYRNQRQGAELVTTTNQLVHQDNVRWRIADRGTRAVSDAAGRYDARVALIRGGDGLLAAAQWYWLDPERTTSDARAKADLVLDRVLVRGDTAAWVAVVTPAQESLRDGWPVLEEFLRDMGGSIQQGLTAMARR